MGHGIDTLDRVVGLELFWHGLNEVVKEITFANSGQTFGILDKEIGDYGFIEPLKTAVSKKDFETAMQILSGLTPIQGWKAFQCSDNGHTLHVAKESYKPIQPERIWQIVGNTLSNVPHKIVSAGTIGNRASMFVSVEILDGKNWSIAGQDYQNHLNFLLGNDGKMGLVVHDCSFKVVCKNTFNASLAANHNLTLAVYHTKNAEDKIKDFEKTIETITQDRELIYAKLGELESVACDTSRAEKIFMGFLMDKIDKPSTRTKNQCERLSELFGDARKGNFAKTLRNVFEAGTDYYTHESSGGKNLWKQFESSEVGLARNSKVELFQTLTDGALLKQTEERGEGCFLADKVVVTVAEPVAASVESLFSAPEAPVAVAEPAPVKKASKGPKTPKAPKLPKSR